MHDAICQASFINEQGEQKGGQSNNTSSVWGFWKFCKTNLIRTAANAGLANSLKSCWTLLKNFFTVPPDILSLIWNSPERCWCWCWFTSSSHLHFWIQFLKIQIKALFHFSGQIPKRKKKRKEDVSLLRQLRTGTFLLRASIWFLLLLALHRSLC